MLVSSTLVDDRVYASLDSLQKLQFMAFGFSFLPRQPITSLLAGRHASRIRGRGLDFDELRRYLPGDDIRNLDWKVTKRTGKPHVRSFREERERQVLLLCDQRIGMFFGSRNKMKSVVAAETTALAAWKVVGSGDRVGALLFNDTRIQEVRPQRSRKTILYMLNCLVKMNHALRAGQGLAQNSAQLNRVLREAERLSGHDYLVVLVSDLNGWDSHTVRLVKRMARHNDVLVALVHDPLERELPAARELVLSDGEQQIHVDPRRQPLTEQYRQDFIDSVGYLQSELSRHGVPVLPIDTVEPVARQVRDAIGERQRRR
jgi:uncharacterized protein (DUF58 family)